MQRKIADANSFPTWRWPREFEQGKAAKPKYLFHGEPRTMKHDDRRLSASAFNQPPSRNVSKILCSRQICLLRRGLGEAKNWVFTNDIKAPRGSSRKASCFGWLSTTIMTWISRRPRFCTGVNSNLHEIRLLCSLGPESWSFAKWRSHEKEILWLGGLQK